MHQEIQIQNGLSRFFFTSINFSDFKLIVLIKANAKNNTKNTCIMGMLISKCQRQEFFDWCKTSFDIPDSG